MMKSNKIYHVKGKHQDALVEATSHDRCAICGRTNEAMTIYSTTGDTIIKGDYSEEFLENLGSGAQDVAIGSICILNVVGEPFEDRRKDDQDSTEKEPDVETVSQDSTEKEQVEETVNVRELLEKILAKEPTIFFVSDTCLKAIYDSHRPDPVSEGLRIYWEMVYEKYTATKNFWTVSLWDNETNVLLYKESFKEAGALLEKFMGLYERQQMAKQQPLIQEGKARLQEFLNADVSV